MKALCIILGIAVLLAVLMIIRINCVFTVGFSSKDGGYVELYIKYLFFKKSILPIEEKLAQREVEKEEEKTPEQNEEEKTGGLGIIKIYKVIKGISGDVNGLIKFIAERSVTIRDFRIESQIGAADPMLTGLAIGGANAFVYGLLGMLDSKMKLKSFYVSIEPDWSREIVRSGMYTVINTNIINILTICAKAGVILIKSRRLIKDCSRKGKNNGE